MLPYTVTCFLTLCLWHYSQAQDVRIYGSTERVVRTDTPFEPSGATAKKKIVLLGEVFQEEGHLLGFGVYFVRNVPITVQIYRPTGGNNGTYTLMYTNKITPKQDKIVTDENINLPYTKLRTDIQIANVLGVNGCPIIKPNDRLAILLEQGGLPIGNSFDVQSQSIIEDIAIPPQIGQTKAFSSDDSIKLPYKLNLFVAYDVDLTHYIGKPYSCHPFATMPPMMTLTTPLPPSTTTQDLRGPPGPQGPQGNPGPAGPAGNPGQDGLPGPQGPQGPAGPAGIAGSLGPPGNDGQQGAQGPAGLQGSQGPKGEIGHRGDPGQNGKDGQVGPDGPTGPQGVSGPQGLPGPKGDKGPAGGDGGPDTGAATGGTCDCGSGLLHRNVILGLIVWLLILTLLVIMLLILMTRKSHQDQKRDSIRSFQRESPWMDGMRDDVWKDYNIDTISQGH